jgi:hypothetical protein
MMHAVVVFACLTACCALGGAAQTAPAPANNYEQTYPHELKPHRHIFPTLGVQFGMDQYRLILNVSPSGDVTKATLNPESHLSKFWPQIREEVLGWKFTPFLTDGKPAATTVEEYIDLVPPEVLPANHTAAPQLRKDSEVAISLERGMCYGRCPVYAVTITTKGIVFDGYKFVVAEGKHPAPVDPIAVRDLAARFIAADFYSMNPKYTASVTDNPGYTLSISIDGHKKQVFDYVGQSIGMPAVIKELEDAVDELAQDKRWIDGEPAPSASQ